MGEETDQAQSDDLSRRHFLGLTGAWTGALAMGHPGVASTLGASGTPPVSRARQFIQRFAEEPPFSFRYAGQSSSIVLKTWGRTVHVTRLDARRTAYFLTWTDARTHLVVRCNLVEYHDFPTVEWTVFFKNVGATRSSPVSSVLAIDTQFAESPTTNIVLHTFDGSTASQTDYQPYARTLPANQRRILWCQGGRPTNGTLPYFNIDWGGSGVIAAVAWPGQWTAQIARDNHANVHVQAGMTSNDPSVEPVIEIGEAQLTNTWLNPGEEIRTPLIVLQFWQAPDWIDAQNVWRRWMIAHNMPRLPSDTPPPISPTGAVDGYYPGLLDTSADELLFLHRYIAKKATVGAGGSFDHWWMDAGWYTLPAGATDWGGVGTWQPDPRRFPHGLRPVTDQARAAGMKAIVWHEPERVVGGTWLYNNHRDWLLGPGPDGNTWLLNLGNPHAWQWVVEHFDQLIRNQGVDVFRQDFNMDPLDYWQMGDPEGRSGITQIRHVTGYLAFWDELRRRHPRMLIDSCASGGRRNDLETLRRAVPLLRSDYQFEPTGQQCHTYGLSFWLPYYGTGVGPASTNGGQYGSGTYVMRSSLAPCYASSLDVRTAPASDWELMRRMTLQWSEIAVNLLGDYYPLTEYSVDTDVWMAWQFHRPEVGQGVVLAFRRPDSSDLTVHVTLRGLEAHATYEVRNFDVESPSHATGQDLMRTGARITVTQRPGAATIAYKKITG